MNGLCSRGVLFTVLVLAASTAGGLAPLRGRLGADIQFRGPAQALAALAACALVAFAMPWGARRPVESGSAGEDPPGEPSLGAGSRSLLAAGLAVGAWLPFGALWLRSHPAASGRWVFAVAGAIAVASALRELAANREAPSGRTAGGLLVVLWAVFACFVLPGEPRWLVREAPGVGPGARGEWELIEADVDLAGPLTSATVAYDGYPPLMIEADLLAGESRRLRAWIVAPKDRSFAAHERPDLVDADPVDLGGVAVKPIGLTGPQGPGAPGGEDSPAPVDPLTSRPLPPIQPPGRGIPLSAWLAAAASSIFLALIVLRFRERLVVAPLALVVGVGSAAFCLGDVGSGPSNGPGPMDGPGLTVVLEGLRSQGGPPGGGVRWAVIERFRGPLVEAISLAGAGQAQPRPTLRIEDLRGPLRTRLSVTSAQSAQRSIEVRDPAQPIDRIVAPFDPGLRLLMPEVNTLGAFGAAWVRSPDGRWSGGGPWAVGAAWAGGGATASEPPAWVGAALPMGVSVFVGRLEAAAARSLDLPLGGAAQGQAAGPEPAAWVRLLAF